MENGYGYDLNRQHSGVWRSLRDGDFEEQDIWDVLRERRVGRKSIEEEESSSISVPRNIPTTAARMIPTSSNNNSCKEPKVLQQSAPVNIPDWSKIYRRNSKRSSSNNAETWSNGDDRVAAAAEEEEEEDYGGSDDEFDESEYSYKMPPHELIARRLAKSQISSFSVFEGVGRTLKGRDLSKVRNAVLTKTGFLESL